MYYSYFYSRLQYGIELYGHSDKGLMKELQVLQNKALKVLHNKDFLTPTKALHKELKVILVKDIQHQNILKFVWKQRNGDTPEAFTSYFTENNNIHGHNTRQAKNLHPIKAKTRFGKKSIKYYGANLWNSIDDETRTAETLKSFAHKVKEKYLEGYLEPFQ